MTATHQDPDWLVVRYRTLSAWLKEAMKASKLEIFHKYRLSKVQRGAKTEVHEIPVLSGYIFVHAPFDETKAWAESLNLFLMRDPFVPTDKEGHSEEDKFIHIPHQAMVPFMNAVNSRIDQLQFTDSSAFDRDKDDLVRFIDGEMKGAEGYLKPGKGRNGGTVIVPLSGSDNDKSALCYQLEARQEQLTIIAFAKNNRHAKDCIIDIRPTVNEAFERLKVHKQQDATTRQKLLAFVSRYGQAQLNTSTQRANHYALLYRIHAILGNDLLCQEFRKVLKDEIIPDLIRRRDAALKRNNPDAASKHSLLLQDIEETRKAAQKPRRKAAKGKSSHS